MILPKALLDCEKCSIPIKVIQEDYEAGVASSSASRARRNKCHAQNDRS